MVYERVTGKITSCSSSLQVQKDIAQVSCECQESASPLISLALV